MKQVLDSTLSRLSMGRGYHRRALEFGERAWRVKGRFADIIYWDMGNSWCDIIKVIPKKGHEDWVQKLYDQVEASADE